MLEDLDLSGLEPIKDFTPPAGSAAADDTIDLSGLEPITPDATMLESFGRGVDIAQGSIGGTIEAVGEATGSEKLTQFGGDIRRRNEEEAASVPSRMPMTEIDSTAKLWEYSKDLFSEQAAIMGPMFAGGMAGAYAGGMAGAPLGPVGAAIGGTIGGFIGAFVPAWIFGVGDTQSAIKSRGEEFSAPGYALIGGTAVATLDTVLPGKIGGKLISTFGFEPAEKIAKRFLLKQVAKEAGKSMAIEAMTEAMQEAISEVAASYGTDTPISETLPTEMGEAAFAGGLFGLVGGGATSIATGARDRGGANAGASIRPPEDQRENVPPGARPADDVTGAERPETIDEQIDRLQREGAIAAQDMSRPDSPNLTPEDRASPIPNDLIDDGKQILDDATRLKTGTESAQSAIEPSTVLPQSEAASSQRSPASAGEQPQGDGSPRSPVTISSPEDVNRGAERTVEPTPAQAEAGNYRKRHVQWQGLDIAIETEAGAMRRGVDSDGESWEVVMPVPYGEIKRTSGKDGDAVDVYLGPSPGGNVYVIDQIDPATGKLDEHKIMAGFDHRSQAILAYDAAFSDGSGPSRRKSVTPATIDELKAWLDSGDTKKEFAGAQTVEVSQRARPTRKAPLDLIEFLASKGGVQDYKGELASLDLGRKFVPGSGRFVRKDGLTLDMAREAAEEAGYIHPVGEQTTTIRDLLNAIERTARGDRVYALEDMADVEARQAEERQADEQQDIERTAEQIRDEVDAAGGTLQPGELEQILDLVILEGAAIDDAIAEVFERNAIDDLENLPEQAGDEERAETETAAASSEGTQRAGEEAASRVERQEPAAERGRQEAPSRPREERPGGQEDQAQPARTEPTEGITFAEFSAALPKDGNGDPDLAGIGRQIMASVSDGKAVVWADLNPDQQRQAVGQAYDTTAPQQIDPTAKRSDKNLVTTTAAALPASAADVLARAQAFADPIAVALRAADEHETVVDELTDLRVRARTAERDLIQKHQVRNAAALEDASLTDAERDYLYYTEAPTEVAGIDDLLTMIEPVFDLREAATAIRRVARSLPATSDIDEMSATARESVGRLLFLGSEIARLGGDPKAVIRDAINREAARYEDEQDAEFMARSLVERLAPFVNTNQARIEPGAEGKPQTVIPGAERITDAELAQRRADERNQTDLVDMARQAERQPEAAPAPATNLTPMPVVLNYNPDKLTAQADNLAARAEEKLNADRNTNTARRARMAASAEADARADLRLANTMRNIADAQRANQVDRLATIRAKSHVEALESELVQARIAHARATDEDYQKARERGFTEADIEHARAPAVTIHNANLKSLLRAAEETKGLKQAARRLGKFTRSDDTISKFTSLSDLSDLSAIAKALKDGRESWNAKRALDDLRDYDRLTQTMNIRTVDDLKAALREYLPLRGETRREDPAKAAERALIGIKIPGFFQTPVALAQRMVEEAGIRPGMTVLEPEAGAGRIADAVRAAGVEPETVERSGQLRELLQQKGHNLVGSDFMEFEGGPYDRIVMNPPFEKGQDMDHVRRAFDMLKPDGRLVAIMGEGAFFRDDRKATEFRAWLDERGGVSEQLPVGTFKESGTGASTRLVIVDKSGEAPAFSLRTGDFESPAGNATVEFDDPWQRRVFELGRQLMERNGLDAQAVLDRAFPDEIDMAGLDYETASLAEQIGPYMIGETIEPQPKFDEDGQPIPSGRLDSSDWTTRQPTSSRDMAIAAMEAAASILDEAANRTGRMHAGSIIEPDLQQDWSRIVMRGMREEAQPGGVPSDRFNRQAELFARRQRTATEKLRAAAPSIGEQMRAALDQMGLGHIGLRMVEAIVHTQDGKASLADGRYFKGYIDIALDAKDPHAVVNHEAIHALKRTGAFTNKEWDALTRRAEGTWLRQYDIEARYGDFPRKTQIEEAVAHAYADWATKKRKEAGVFRRAFEKIRNIIEATRNALRGEGFTSVNQIFADIAGGMVGRRRVPADVVRKELPAIASRDGDLFRGGEVLETSDGPRFSDPKTSALWARVWHGSPHRFLKFMLEHIGTGEGAQAFGWGLYFTDRKSIAEHYREKLLNIDRDKVRPDQEAVKKWQKDWDNLVEQLRPLYAKLESADPYERNDIFDRVTTLQTLQDAIHESMINETIDRLKASKGGLYRIEIPDHDELLIWDAPVSDQPESVQQAIASLPFEVEGAATDNMTNQEFDRLFTDVGKRLTKGTKFGKSVFESGLAWEFLRGKYGAADEAILKNLIDERPEAVEPIRDLMRKAREPSGEQIYEQLGDYLANETGEGVDWDTFSAFQDRVSAKDRAASEYLRDKLGIPGHRYLDGGSRHRGDGSYNYVIYDEDRIAIEEVFALRRDPETAEDRQRVQQGWLARGQLLDQAFRIPFDIFGGVDAEGRWNPGIKLNDQAKRIIVDAKFSDDGIFRFMNPMLHTARSGLVDRYGLSQEFVERERRIEQDARRRLMEGREFLEVLKNEHLSLEEAKILGDVLTGEAVGDNRMQRLAEPIRRAMTEVGQEAVELGLISRESYERNLGTYLHRVYMKHEEDQAGFSGLSRMATRFFDKRRKRIIGNELKGRGIFRDVDIPKVRSGNPTWPELPNGIPGIGDKFRVIEERSPQERMVLRPDEEAPQPRVLRRIYLPEGMAVPERYQGVNWHDDGIWEIRSKKGNQFTVWRDYTREERERMGQIFDARYSLAKTYMLLANDLATGRFFKDVAQNEDWARSNAPDAKWVNASEMRLGSHLFSSQDIEWVRVPNTEIPGTGKVKRWGALADMWVRAEIWRDLAELDRMNRGGAWRKLLNEWKLNKTAMSPVVHMNNVMSNFLLMDMVDIRLQDLQRGIRAYVSRDATYHEALEHGAFGSDMMSQEIRDNVLTPLLREIAESTEAQLGGATNSFDAKMRFMGKLVDGLWNGYSWTKRKASDVYQAEDEIFRMAMFIRRREMGDDAFTAADMARQQFIDYDIRAPWVNAARRSVLPFASYIYRAVPVIARSIAWRPWKYAKYMTIMYAANMLAYMLDDEADEEKERASLREEEQGSTWLATPRMLRLGRDVNNLPTFIDVRRWIPGGDVFDMNQGHNAFPLPAWAQLGGPAMMAFEFYLNKKAFDGEQITNELTDTTWEKAKGVADWLWKSWAPSAAFVPGSWYWTRFWNAYNGATDARGRPYSVPQALASSIGIKIKPQDVEQGLYWNAYNMQKIGTELRTQARSLGRQRERGLISQEAFDAGMQIIELKMERLQERMNELGRIAGKP